jgi:hypothetical protein
VLDSKTGIADERGNVSREQQARRARISSRNRSNGFSITGPTHTAVFRRIPARPSTTSSKRTRATPKRLTACIEILLGAGAHTRYDMPGVLSILRARNDELAALLDADPALLRRRYAG